MSANLLQEIPTIVPCYSTNGSSFLPNQQVEFEIPSSVQSFIPAETFISLDVQFPNVTDTVTLANYIPPQAWGSAGVHGVIRDIVCYNMATGQEMDRINYYDQASKMLPFHLSENDSTAYLAQQEGLNLWKANCLQRGPNIALNQNLNSVDPFDLHYFHQTNATNNSIVVASAGTTGTRSRIVRYSVPIRWGFLNAGEEYMNFQGVRVVITLNPASECVDYLLTGKNLWLQNTGSNSPPSIIIPPFTTVLGPAGATTLLIGTGNPTVNLDKSDLLALANAYPCGTVMSLTDGTPVTESVRIQGWDINGSNVQVTFAPATVAVTGQSSIAFPLPTNRNNLSYTVQNPIMYVRQLNTDPMVIQQRLEEIKKDPQSAVYSFRTLYNYPLSINANVSNPVLNFNSVALQHAQGIAFVFKNESDMNNMNAKFPARLSSVLLSSTTLYPTNNPNIRQYQIKLGNKLIINQPVAIDNLVPQVLNKEVSNFLEIACGKKFCNAGYHTMDSAISLSTQTKTDIDEYYNRVIATALVNNSDSAMDITNQNIQLLLFTPISADPSSYTCNMYISHFKHVMTTPNGIVIEQ